MLLSWFGCMPYGPNEIGQGFVVTIQGLGEGEGLDPHNIALMLHGIPLQRCKKCELIVGTFNSASSFNHWRSQDAKVA
jgi:hypothetical protein